MYIHPGVSKGEAPHHMMKSKAFTKLREHMIVATNSLKGVRGAELGSTAGKKRKAVLSPK